MTNWPQMCRHGHRAGFGFRILGLGFGLRVKVEGLGCRVQSLGHGAQGRVQGLEFRFRARGGAEGPSAYEDSVHQSLFAHKP